MTPRVQLSATAQRDVADARAWYAERQVPGLDRRFQRELERTLGEVESYPERFPIAHRDVRRANLHRFPYAVIYHRRGKVLYVLGVIHQARHPRVWRRRT